MAALTGAEFLAIRGFEWSSPRQAHQRVVLSRVYRLPRDRRSVHAGLLRMADQGSACAWRRGTGEFQSPGREVVCFDGCLFVPPLDERIVALECFNRGDDYGDAYFRPRSWLARRCHRRF